MSKLNKEQKQAAKDQKTIIKDTEKVFDFIKKFESLDLEKASLANLQKEINEIQADFKKKYKKYLDKEDLEKFEEDLDIEK